MRFVHAPILYYCIPINKNEVTGNREMPMLREWLTSDFVMYLTYLSQRKYARQTLEYFANDVEYYCLNNTSEDTFLSCAPKNFWQSTEIGDIIYGHQIILWFCVYHGLCLGERTHSKIILPQISFVSLHYTVQHPESLQCKYILGLNIEP